MKSISYRFILLLFTTNGIFSQMIATRPTTTMAPCPCLSMEMIESKMIELFERYFQPLSSKLSSIEMRLNELEINSRQVSGSINPGIYTKLSVRPDWIELYSKPYNESTTTEELRRMSQQCRNNRVLVGAMEYENATMLTVAAVGSTCVLQLNTKMTNPEEIDNVLWYFEPGRAFGFGPKENQGNQSAQSELFLSWAIDLNYGGWRAGVQTNLYKNSVWRKVIYCLAMF